MVRVEIDELPGDDPRRVFLEEIIAVCKKHGFSISHQDGQGAFIIVPFDQFYVDWLMDAEVQTDG